MLAERAGVRLDVGMVGAEELFGAVAGQVLDDVGVLASAVVALAGIALGVLVGEDRAGGFKHGLADKVFRGDEFETVVLAVLLVGDGLGDLRVHRTERTRHG